MLIKKIFCRAAKRGFSLIELLLVLTLAPIIFFAVYSNFISGVHLWQRMQVGTPEEDQAIFRMKAQRDFQNVLRYASMPFEGDKDGVAFTAGIEADEELGGKRALGRLRYYYDEPAHAIARETRDFSQAYRDAPGLTILIAQNVASFEFSYLVKDPLAHEYLWKEDFRPSKPGDLPLAVRLTVATRNPSTSTEHTFFIPAGGALK